MFGVYVVGGIVAYGLGRRSVRREYFVLERGIGTEKGIVPCLFIYPGSMDKPGYVLNQETGRVIEIRTKDGTLTHHCLNEPQKNLATLTEQQGCVEVTRDDSGTIVGAKITPKGQQVLKDLESGQQDPTDVA